MPNWCTNQLLVASKDKVKVQELFDTFVLNSLVEGVFDILIPTPKELINDTSPNLDEEKTKKYQELYDARDWYDWRVNNWGTKWDINEVFSSDGIYEDNGLWAFVCSFDSAWSPPEAAIEKISALFENVYFYMDYREEGMGFTGYCSFFNGEDQGSVTVEAFATADDVSTFLDSYFPRENN